MKKCKSCDQQKPLNEFYADKWKSDGLRRVCKACDKARVKYLDDKRRGNVVFRAAQAAAEKQKRINNTHCRENARRGARIYRLRFPEKSICRESLNRALRRGDVTRPMTCEACGKTPEARIDGRSGLQAHHADYSKPLDVKWMCVRCHTDEHRSTRGQNEASPTLA